MTCRLYTYEVHRRGGFGERIEISRCGADNHICNCAGDIADCDKDPRVCPFSVWQGREVYCKQVREIRECRADIDFCDLTDSDLRCGVQN
jgi:hypothetical protein